MTGYSNIAVYYNTMFSLMQQHKYSMSDLNDMYPYERDLFVDLLMQHLKQVEEQRKNG